MVIVAVAGGTHGLGRTIVEAIQGSGKHEVVILSRKADADLEKSMNVRILPVNYGDIDSTAAILEENQVNTVISTINALPDLEPESNLIKAAEKSNPTRRLIPSMFSAFDYVNKDPHFSAVTEAKTAVIAEARKTSLEIAYFVIGVFMDYFGNNKIPSHIRLWPVFLDVNGNEAAIPGTGNEIFATTHSMDVAKLVVAYLSLPEWREANYIVSERTCYNELIKLVEDAKGVKIKVSYNPREDIEAGNLTELPAYQPLYSAAPKELIQNMMKDAAVWWVRGDMDIPSKGARTVNEDFPENKSLSLKEFLTRSWKD